MLRLIVLGLLLALSQAATAATVTVDVRDADGRPVSDAVVTIETPHAPAGPIRFPWPYAVRQQDISFRPHVLVVPVGATVAFPNMDRVRHHVYSFSKPKAFELKLYGQDQSRSVVFDRPGVVAIGCNIHDAMSGFVVVVATPYAGKTDSGGYVAIPDLPVGTATLKIWSPQVRAPGNQISQTIAVPAAGLAKTVTVG